MKKYANEYLDNKEGIIDLQNKSNHPITFQYSEIFDSCLLKANMKEGRIQPFFKLLNSPFYNAVIYSIEEPNCFNRSKCKKRLESFYNCFQPKNLAEWFMIKEENKTKLKSKPPWSSVLPWRARSIDSYTEAIINASKKEVNKNNIIITNEYGLLWDKCGPVAKEVIENEIKRLEAIFYSIIKNGYRRSNEKDGDITATALVDENNNWKWLVTSGYHRACVLAALGFNEVTIRVNKVVIKNQSKFWPHVLDDLYTEKEALFIFNKIFVGEKSRN